MAKLETTSYIPEKARGVDRGEGWDGALAFYDALWDGAQEEAQRALDHYIDSGSVIGLQYRHPVADGAAIYRVTKARPFTIQHIEQPDNWHAPAALIRGLRLSDFTEQADADIAWQRMVDERRKS